MHTSRSVDGLQRDEYTPAERVVSEHGMGNSTGQELRMTPFTASRWFTLLV